MSTNANAIFGRLRDLIDATDLNLSQISGRTKIPLNKLWRFKCREKSLSMEDAEKLHGGYGTWEDLQDCLDYIGLDSTIENQPEEWGYGTEDF